MRILLLFLLLSFKAFGGELNFFVFEDGLPKNNFEFVIDGKFPVKSNSDGSVFKNLEQGRHFIEIKKGQQIESISFYVGKSEATQVYLNLFSENDQIKTELSEPSDSKELVNLKKGKLGTISGRVLNQEGKPIAGTRVYIQGIKEKITSSSSGHYSAMVPEGRYIMSFVHKEYSTESIRNISVLGKKQTIQDIKLNIAGLELEEFVVVAPHVKGSLSALIEVRRNSTSVAEVMGSEQISKSGDSNAAASLKRVTGLSIVDGKYVYIRGLGERYSNVLLNGTVLPSPDPTRRVVQLDLFPSGILQSLVVQKSYSPEYSGSFGGGIVILNTKDIPEEFEAKITLGTSYASGNSSFNTYQGGSKDWLGIDDGTRELPASILKATTDGKRLFKKVGNNGGFTTSELRQYSKDMPRIYNTTNERAEIPPNLSISIGDVYKYKGKKFGYLLSGMYSNFSENENRTIFEYNSEGEKRYQSDIDSSMRTIKLSGMLNLGVDLGKYAKITSNTLILRNTTDRVLTETRTSINDTDSDFRDIGIEWQERELLSQILKGKHQLGSNKKRILEWRGAYSIASRDQPDSRNYQQDFREGAYITSTDGKRNQKLYNELEDNAQDFALKIDSPIIKNNWLDISGKVGGQYTRKDRDSTTKRFKYGQVNADTAKAITNDQNILAKSIQEICTNAVIDAGGCILEDLTDASDRYSANQIVKSYFVDSETKISNFMRVNMGVRVEESEQSITTYRGIDRNKAESGLVMNDILPVFGLTFFLTDTIQLRGAYSETVSRPDFKDLNPGSYFDDEKSRLVNGNSNLKGTIIKNFDTRIEWYFGKNENLSLGLFKKEFLNPIEEVAGSFDKNGRLSASTSKFQLANIGNAEASGFEIEARKNFGFINKGFEYLILGGNYSEIKSEVDIFDDLSEQVTNKVRPLQGQSEYVLNINLGYDNPDTGFIATALFNVFGRRIDAVGTNPFDDVYEESFNQLDFVVSQKFGIGNIVKLKLNNLLNPEAIRTESGRIKERFRKGRAGSISYTRTF